MRGGLAKKVRDISWRVGEYDVGSVEGLRGLLVDVLKSLVMNPNSVNRARALVGPALADRGAPGKARADRGPHG